MRQQLIQYVDLLFAGAGNCEEIRQEILQNTLDRYDDLVMQGKSPEAAYRLAISGIGDIGEILRNAAPAFSTPNAASADITHSAIPEEQEDPESKKQRAAAIAMYILCPVPLFILGELGFDTLGLCLTLVLIAAATALITISRKKSSQSAEEVKFSPQQELKKSIGNVIWAIGLVVYFSMSFATNAWYLTWVIFPITASVQGLANAICDLKEANKYEK